MSFMCAFQWSYELVPSVNRNHHYHCEIWHRYWIFDAHKVFLREIVINLALAISGVFVITTILLGSLLPSIICALLLVVIDVEVRMGSISLLIETQCSLHSDSV
jgi:hypothetical protein